MRHSLSLTKFPQICQFRYCVHFWTQVNFLGLVQIEKAIWKPLWHVSEGLQKLQMFLSFSCHDK